MGGISLNRIHGVHLENNGGHLLYQQKRAVILTWHAILAFQQSLIFVQESHGLLWKEGSSVPFDDRVLWLWFAVSTYAFKLSCLNYLFLWAPSPLIDALQAVRPFSVSYWHINGDDENFLRRSVRQLPADFHCPAMASNSSLVVDIYWGLILSGWYFSIPWLLWCRTWMKGC